MLPLRVRFAEFLERLSNDPDGIRRLIGLAMVLALLGTLIGTGNLSLVVGKDRDAASAVAPGGGLVDGATTSDFDASIGGVEDTGGRSAGDAVTARPSGTGTRGAASVGGTSGGSAPGAPAATVKAGCTGAKLKATDRGVHEKTIDVALFTVDLAALEAVGFGLGTGEVVIEEIVAAWEKEFNARGGIACRELNLIHVLGQLEENDQAAKCKSMSQDLKVFAVLSPGGNVVGGPCLAIEEKMPLVTALAAPDRWRSQGAPYMWDILMSQEQYMRNQARWLVTSGDLKVGKTKLGIVYADENYSGVSVEKAMIPELKRWGVTPTKVAKLPYDSGQAASQVPQVVVDFQSAGIDMVIMPMNLVYKTQFLQQAEQQGYRPAYRDSDYTVSCQTFTTGTYPPNQWDGTKCVTSGGYSFLSPNGLNQAELEKYLAANAYARYAEKVYKAANPGGYSNGGERNADDTEAQRASHLLIGTLLHLFAQGADRAGPNLTRQTWGEAMGQTTAFEMSVSPKPLTFGPKDWTGPDYLHVVQWEKDASNGYEANSYRKLLPPFKAWY